MTDDDDKPYYRVKSSPIGETLTLKTFTKIRNSILHQYMPISGWILQKVLGLACSKIDVLSFKRQEIERSFFLIAGIFASEFLFIQNALGTLYYSVVLTASSGH